MSDDADQSDKTESPSPRRLQKARDDGNLPIGKDLSAVLSLALGVAGLWMAGPRMMDELVDIVQDVAANLHTTPFQSLWGALARPFSLGIAICATIGLGAVIAGVAQTKGELWTDKLSPDATRLFQPSRLKRLFERELLEDTALAFLKVFFVGWVAWSAVRDDFMTLGKLLFNTGPVQLAAIFGPLFKVAVKSLTAMLILAGVDLALTHRRFTKKMMMTKEELKREHKEDEGDPSMKGRRKKRHRELLKGNVRADVPRADALVVNPTHIAIAIRYRKGEGGAPRVLAKGKGAQAEVMRDIARENGIPIVQDITLARLLFKKVKVGGAVPAQTYKAVAAILAFVYRVTGKKPGALEARA